MAARTSPALSSPDAVIVGAGHNGLVAANLLADAGWDVVVCEAAEVAGGAVQTAQVTVPGFHTDLFSAFYPLAVASPVINQLGLADYGLRWSTAPAVLTHVMPDDSAVTIWPDIDRTADELGRDRPADADAWRRLVRQWESIQEPLLQALLRPFPPVLPAARLARTLGIGASLRMARMAVQPVRRFGEENFAGAGGPILFAGNALHADLPPDGAGSAVYGWLLVMLAQTYGFPVPVGGAGRLIDALVARLTARGGTVRLAAPVVDIEVRSGVATGVVLASGERIGARRAVLADVAAPVLYRRLIGAGHLPPRFLDDLDRFQWDAPTLKIDWALSSPVPWTASSARQAGTIHLGVDMDGLTDYAADLATRRMPARPFLLFGQMTTADPSRSPAGTESAWAYTHLPHRLEFDQARIDAHVELVEATIERHAPGFRAAILGRYVQSPADMQARNGNLLHGAINGGTAQLHQQLVFRPVPGLGNATTPVERLFLASSAAHPGGGVHGAPGANAARAALARARLTGGVRRAVDRSLMRRIY